MDIIEREEQQLEKRAEACLPLWLLEPTAT